VREQIDQASTDLQQSAEPKRKAKNGRAEPIANADFGTSNPEEIRRQAKVEEPPAGEPDDYGADGGNRGAKFEPLRLTFYSELKEATPKGWNIKNVMARGEVSSWFGPPGVGKSAVLTDIAIAGASRPQWRGFRIKESFASIYFALERGDLVKRRNVAHRLLDRNAKNPRARLSELRNRLRRKHLIGVRDELVWLATALEAR
jgi:hypothetical protein